MSPAREFVLGVVGGASGVGKTTLLNAVSWLDRVNTGDLFKRHMALANRDEIRSLNWAAFEGEVRRDLETAVREKAVRGKRGILIDTHFAAKLNGDAYRIGLERSEIFSLASSAVKLASEYGIRLHTLIVHVTAEPAQLLTRRRLDGSRKRELVPSDCVQALTRNEQCSGQYLYEFARAFRGYGRDEVSPPRLTHIMNSDLDRAVSEMTSAFLEQVQ